MSQKLLVVIGATGGQGGAVVNAFLKDSQWKIRGITRNPDSDKAKALSEKGVEMVKADLNDVDSLEVAFQSAHVIFALTDYYENFWTKGWEKSMEIEYAQGTNMAKAASKVITLEHYIWSTLPNTESITGGAITVPHFVAKGHVDDFIREDEGLLSKTTFCFFTTFAYNFIHYDLFKPVYLPAAKKWVQFYPASPSASYPCLGDHRINTGIFIRSLVQNRPPGGTYIKCSVEDHTLESCLAIWGKASGIAPEPGSTQVVEVTPETYVSLFGAMGEEQAVQWKFSKFLAEHIPKDSPVYGIFKDVQQFMSKEAIASLVSVENSFRGIDWAAYGFGSSTFRF